MLGERGQGASSSPQILDENSDSFKILYLEQEVQELKKSLKQERSKNSYLGSLMEQSQKLKVQHQ